MENRQKVNIACTSLDHDTTVQKNYSLEITYTWVYYSQANVTHINRVVISSTTIGIRVDEGRVFPSSREAAVIEENITFLKL